MNDTLCTGHTILYTPAAIDYLPDQFLLVGDVTRGELMRFFDVYQQEEVFSYINRINGEQTPVYRLSRQGICKN